MSQEIKQIDIADLVLWTENPRDPIDVDAKDQDIADRAWIDKQEKWNLLKLAKEMRSHYDLSELPTVVYHANRPVVYDGNRRMILAKLKHNLITLEGFDKSKLPFIPKSIPCNVCSNEIAIENVYRKHGDSGSWSPLDRDLFLHKFMGQSKSIFLKLDEQTGLISSNPHLNKVFVKNEIFTNEKLKDLGFEFEEEVLKSRHSAEESLSILNDVSKQIKDQKITTRKNRGNVLSVLEPRTRLIISSSDNKPFEAVKLKGQTTALTEEPPKRQSPRTKQKAPDLFGGTLYLKTGQVSDLYRDIAALYRHYLQEKNTYSQYFPSLIRMSLRLLAEAAAKDLGVTIGEYLKQNFTAAKKPLDADAKTTLFSQSVNETSIEQLLHIGAHNYSAARNMDQTIAVSLILGKMIEKTHGR